MTFDYTFEYNEDKVFFAYSNPYTFTQLIQLINNVNFEQEKIPKEERYVKCEKVCKRISGIEIPFITVTSDINSNLYDIAKPPKEKIITELIESETTECDIEISSELKEEIIKKFNNEKKKVLIVTARIHPGETCGSYVMEGFIKFITSSNPVAVKLRERLIIRIIPMRNIDGVIAGNYRCCLSGKDLNRSFTNPDRKLLPLICEIKKIISD